MMRIGHGYDVHAFAEGRKLILGGVEIPYEVGLLGHSDGAAGDGDIGGMFPDNDDRFLGADSLVLLEQVVRRLDAEGYRIGNIDATVIAQAPKLAPYIGQMRDNIARVCGIAPSYVNVKATTEEHLGFTGRKEGISAHAVALIAPKES